jgi:NAD(P)H-hydrate repair Nnr-like enzyme with NAD(P)H-hydrate dehydratase domain
METVMTPHPLEAARLLGVTTAAIQGNRPLAASHLAQRFGCVVVLKGSGTVLATPTGALSVNPTGNARLATAGSGDVLAGYVGALLAQGLSGHEAAQEAVFQLGQMAQATDDAIALTADQQALGGRCARAR